MAGKLTQRERTWMILFLTSLCSFFIFGWVFSAIVEATAFGCPVQPHGYCNQWQTIMNILWPVFLALFAASLISLITVLILRVTPWYRGGKGQEDARSRHKKWLILLLCGISSTALWLALTIAFLFVKTRTPGLWAVFCAFLGISLIFTTVVGILRCTPWYKGQVVPSKEIGEPSENAPEYGEVTNYQETTKFRNDIAKN